MHRSASDLDRIRGYVEDARRANRLRLPPEAELAKQLGVTRSRLRVMLKKLEAEALIWRHVGKGTFVGERSLAPDLGSLPERVNPLEAFEARLTIEPQLAALAALRATPRQVEDMRDCLERMQAVHDFEQWALWDEKLHRLIAKAASNTLLLAVYDTIRESAPTGMQNRIHSVYSAGPRHETDDEHRGFVEAIAERDPNKAEQLMAAHLRSIRAVLFGDR